MQGLKSCSTNVAHVCHYSRNRNAAHFKRSLGLSCKEQVDGGGSRHLHRCSERMSQSCRQTDRASPLAGRQHHQTSLHLRPFPLLPLERSLLGAAAAAAPPVTAAQAPFSCSSPLLFVRLLFFPLLLFWLGILQDSSVKCYFRPLSTAPVSAV